MQMNETIKLIYLHATMGCNSGLHFVLFTKLEPLLSRSQETFFLDISQIHFGVESCNYPGIGALSRSCD